jgi:glutaredoxin
MKQLSMYTRERTCGDQQLARMTLKELGVEAIEINISLDPDAAQMLADLIGCLAVPTLVIADEDNNPIEPLTPLAPYQSIRNVDRGAVISEPSGEGLRRFLSKHGLL